MCLYLGCSFWGWVQVQDYTNHSICLQTEQCTKHVCHLLTYPREKDTADRFVGLGFFSSSTHIFYVMLYSISWCLTMEESLQQAFKLCINCKIGLYRKKLCVSAQRQIFATDFTKVKLFLWVWFLLGSLFLGWIGFWVGLGFFWLGWSARWAQNNPETENSFQSIPWRKSTLMLLEENAYFSPITGHPHSSLLLFLLQQDDLVRLKTS